MRRAAAGANSNSRLWAEAQAIAHLGSWEWDVASGALIWTDEHYRIFGLDPADFTPTLENALDNIHENDQVHLRSVLANSVERAEPFSCVVRIRRPSGEVRWIESVGVPSVVAGVVVSMIGTVLDVTGREESLERLRDSEARYKTIVETACEAIWLVDAGGITTFGNEQLASMLGRPLDEIIGTSAFDFLDAEGRAIAAENLAGPALGGARRFDFRLVRPDGTEVWTMLSAAPILNAHGRYAGTLAMLTDITERKVSEEQLVHLALHDTLTGLPNRSLFRDRLQRALVKQSTPVTVMLLDLDGFKAINDSIGHSAGDGLIIGIADRLSSALRPTDTVARFGGDEFAIIVEGGGEIEAEVAATRLLKVLESPFVIEARTFLARASIGIAFANRDARSVDEVLRDADAAVHQAKAKGGCRYELFDPEQQATNADRIELESDLRTVQLGVEMTLHYQPLVDLRDGRVTGFEALLRWNHPQRGMLSPADFVPIAEMTGAIVPIGRWVVEEACRQARLFQQHHPAADGLGMNVNISARQLTDPEIVRDVARALDLSGLSPSLLTLEVTETMIMADEDAVGVALRQLKQLGVRISIDDFGTGFSSIGQLDHFPVDELKIDRSFVARLGRDAEAHSVALALIRLGRSLQIDVVAEGIEREDQLEQLRDAGCTRGQGYYFWRPLAVPAVEILLDGMQPSALPREQTRVILVVEDDDDVRRSTGRIISAAGYEVVEAATGRHAIDAVRTRRLDAVVLDVQLPDIDGFEICSTIKELTNDELPVLILSGAAITVADRVHGLDLGADGYLVKPTAPAELVATLAAILRNRRGGHPDAVRPNGGLPEVPLGLGESPTSPVPA